MKMNFWVFWWFRTLIPARISHFMLQLRYRAVNLHYISVHREMPHITISELMQYFIHFFLKVILQNVVAIVILYLFLTYSKILLFYNLLISTQQVNHINLLSTSEHHLCVFTCSTTGTSRRGPVCGSSHSPPTSPDSPHTWPCKCSPPRRTWRTLPAKTQYIIVHEVLTGKTHNCTVYIQTTLTWLFVMPSFLS